MHEDEYIPDIHSYELIRKAEDSIADTLLADKKKEIEKLGKELKKLEKKEYDIAYEISRIQEAENDIQLRREHLREALRNKRLPDEFMGLISECYTVDFHHAYALPKCPHCNDSRIVKAVGTNGQEKLIPCSCSKERKLVYRIQKVSCIYTGNKDNVPLFVVKMNGCCIDDARPVPGTLFGPEQERKEGIPYQTRYFRTAEEARSYAELYAKEEER